MQAEHQNEKTREIIFLQKRTRMQTVLSCCADLSILSGRKINLQTNVPEKIFFFLNTTADQQF